jgi:hypothetical protein
MKRVDVVASHMDRVLFPVTSRKASIAISAVIIALLSLILFSVRQNILTYDNTLETVYFILTVVIAYGIGSWLLLGYVKQTTRRRTTSTTTTSSSATGPTIQRGPLISLLHMAVVIVQFAILGIMLYVIFDRSSEYLMPYVNAITSVFATVIMIAFAFRILRWYIKGNRTVLVLLYFLTALTIAIMISLDFAVKFMVTARTEVSVSDEVPKEKFLYRNTEEGLLLKQDIEPGSTISYIVPLQFLAAWRILNIYPGLASLYFRWGATSLTLYEYNKYKRLNKTVFWILISVPVILLFVGQLPDYLGITPEPWTRPLFRGANIAIGIMFGLAFLLMARKAPAIKDHLTIAAVGVMIITISFGVTNLQQTFGIAAHSLVLLSSYLFAIGLYDSAISLSHDATLRQSIRRSAKGAIPDLLDSASLAEVQQQMEQKVMKIAKHQSDVLFKQSGVPASLEEGDMNKYLKQVLIEMQKDKKATVGQ